MRLVTLVSASILALSLACQSEEQVRLREQRFAEGQAAAREEQRRYAEMVERARTVAILDSEQLHAFPYEVVGFVAIDTDPAYSGSAVLSLQIQALSLGGDAIAEVAHELIPSNVQSNSEGQAFASPQLNGAVASSESKNVIPLEYVEHWTATVVRRSAGPSSED